jgi:hypothetical protein
MPTKDELLDTLRDQKAKSKDFDRESVLREWTAALKALMADIQSWLRPAMNEELLRARPETTIVSEERLGTYEVPRLLLEMPSGLTVNINPVARFIVGADGRVDMWAFPTDKWLIVRQADQWRLIRKGGDLSSDVPLAAESFKSALTELIRAEV